MLSTDERTVPFSQSELWELQRRYFMETQIDAWRRGTVPHYVTSNPFIAQTYAELLFAFFRDQMRLNPSTDPIYIIELGAGSGRFSYHLIKELTTRWEQLYFQVPKFVYVMTDFVSANLDFWESHPRLQPYFEKGVLDIACFDAAHDTSLQLYKANRTISAGQLSQPIIVIANYFFDSIPQELFYINQGEVDRVYAALDYKKTANFPSAQEAIEQLDIDYSYEPLQSKAFDDSLQNEILELYRQQLRSSHVLFPHFGLECITRLKALSVQGLVLLTADKGFHKLEQWQQQMAPTITKHGSFSLMVNYHAIKEHCRRSRGKALFPDDLHRSITLSALLYLEGAENYKETLWSYDKSVNDFGPDDYFTVKKHLDTQITDLSIPEMFAHLKLSSYDAHLFYQLLPRFHQLVDDFSEAERLVFLKLSRRIWDTYFSLGEVQDLAFEIAWLLLQLQFFDEALSFLELSEKSHGKNKKRLFPKACCYFMMKEWSLSRSLLIECVHNFPDHIEALELLKNLDRLEVSP